MLSSYVSPSHDVVRLPPYYGPPSPPRNYVLAGIGWAYGVGCGAGPFFGMGIAVNRRIVFGAGAGVGVYCGIGFGAGAVMGSGTGFVPIGLISRYVCRLVALTCCVRAPA